MADPALTLHQPHADLVLADDGAGGCLKPVENRTWRVPATLPQWWDCEACDHRWHGAPRCPECGSTNAIDVGLGGPFPFRLWIHAGAQIYLDAPLAAWKRLKDVYGTLSVNATYKRAQSRSGVLLGSVFVTGCHHANECTGDVVSAYTGEVGRNDGMCSRWAEPDRWHWTLTDPRPLPTPVPARGRQRLWHLPDNIAQEVAAHG